MISTIAGKVTATGSDSVILDVQGIGFEIAIPKTLVIGTDVFDDFMRLNDLEGMALSGEDDERIRTLTEDEGLATSDVRQPNVVLVLDPDALDAAFDGAGRCGAAKAAPSRPELRSVRSTS